jgi:alpha-tubulin suppressor-like RCC1 family protein
MHVSRFTKISMFDCSSASTKVKQVSCGDYHTLCLMQDGSLYGWGGTLHKKVGEKNSQVQNNEPKLVQALQGKSIV